MMKSLSPLAFLLVFSFASAQETYTPPWEMTTYYFGLLSRGEKWTPERTEETARIQEAHLAHLNKNAVAGHLVAAGPVGSQGDLRGILIFKTASLEEAQALAASDPAVKAGRLKLDIHPWWGPAGIGDGYWAWRKANPQAEDQMTTYQLGFLVSGPRHGQGDDEEKQRAQRAHLDNITRLAAAGHLIAAGPFTDSARIRGVYIFEAGSVEEAAKLAQTDPSIQEKRLAVELHPLWVAKHVFPGSATK